jgi:hypothetical protein
MSADVRPGDEPPDRESLVAQRDLLREENDRLRDVVSRLERARHRQSAAILAALAFVALLGALAYPAERTVLLALGGTGLFGAVVVRLLVPERSVAPSVGERAYETRAAEHEALAAELDLQDEYVYVPTDDRTSVRLFVPQRSEYELPPRDACGSTFVLTGEPRQRGVAFEPIGAALIDDLRSTMRRELRTDPVAVADQLADGLVESLELADGAVATVDDDGRATIGVVDGSYGPLDRFDHPTPSLFAVGLALALDEPVTLSVAEGDGRAADYLVSCRWDAEGSEGSEGSLD